MTLAKALQAAAGNAGEALFVDSVFSTYLYTGNGSTQTITNGIDLAGEGGLVWTKARNSATESPVVVDTTRGVLNALYTNYAIAQGSLSSSLTAFNSNGYSVGTRDDWNKSGNTYASWTFRKAPKFFDVVTFVGTGANPATQYNHNLGTTPGCIIVKNISSSQAWYVYHRSLTSPANDYLALNTTAASATISGIWGTVSDTQFGFFGNSGQTYVAYLFAHDAGGFGAGGSENVISCGSYVEGSSDVSVTLGYEPAWILVKPTSTTGNWNVYDVMRGATLTGSTAILRPNTSDAEVNAGNYWYPTSTGFIARPGNFGSGVNMIYIAIRRPMKPPESGTEVFTPTTYTGNGTSQIESAGFPTDMAIITNRGAGGGYERNVGDRLRGGNRTLFTTQTVVESTATNRITAFDNMVGVAVGSDGDVNQSSGSQIAWNFKRASGFFDEVCYTATGSGTSFNHNLGVIPELVIFKARDLGAQGWITFYNDSNYVWLNLTNAQATATNFLTRTSTSITTNGSSTPVNSSGSTYVAYLFATYPGVSKVGSYTGNGSSQTINCGFTSGARFVLIKRTDAAGGWFVFDSARGITPGNDPYLRLDQTSAETNDGNYIDAAATGFIVATSNANFNANGGTYIYLAIA